MHIELVLYSDHVEVIFINNSTTQLRLWELWNSWGWWSVSFQIRSDQDTNVSTIMHLWNAEWTMNGPTTFVLVPEEKRGFPINLNNGWWMRDQTIARLKDKTLLIRVSYHANPADASLLRFLTDSEVPHWVKQHNQRLAAEVADVFTGSAVSDWVTSQPPHGWLFAPISYEGETAEQLMQYSPEEVLRRVCALIDQRARDIGLNAKAINGDPSAPLTELEKVATGITAGHLVNSILDYSEEIQKAVKEARAYLEAKTSTKKADGNDINSQG